MKRIISLFLIIGMIFTIFPTNINAVIEYTVTFIAEGGRIYEDSVPHESPYVIKVKENTGINKWIWAQPDDTEKMNFYGWAEKEGGEPQYRPDDIITYYPTEDVTFYAVISETCNLTLVAEGGYFYENPDISIINVPVLLFGGGGASGAFNR